MFFGGMGTLRVFVCLGKRPHEWACGAALELRQAVHSEPVLSVAVNRLLARASAPKAFHNVEKG